MSAAAELQPVQPNTPGEKVANVASSIFLVKDFEIGKFAFKLVALDSELNGDLNTTTMLLVGEGGVGGAAGYESAFQLTPAGARQLIKNVKVRRDSVEITFSNIEGHSQSVRFRYDAAAKVLKEQIL